MDQHVQIFKGEENSLGIGSYGAVYKAKYFEVPCAAKILHPTLFQTNDPGARKILERFQQECNFMRDICHPNIVQFLGVCEDPTTHLPALLMELMDESLTKFLEKSSDPLPYFIQVDFCHDIAVALYYLHLNKIVHRDLSSNNVLLIAERRAKVTDFGMSKLLYARGYSTTRQSATFCPGTEVYMPPEAMKEPPELSEKHDCFTFGVLVIQILTRLFPKPGPRKQEVPHLASPTGMMELPVLEDERRSNHIQLIDPSHPLLPIAFNCLNYKSKDRPTAHNLCCHIAALKETPSYKENKTAPQDAGETSTKSEENKETPSDDTSQQVQELQQKCEKLDSENLTLSERVSDAEKQLQSKERELKELGEEKDRVIRGLQVECTRLRKSLNSTSKDLQIKEHQIRSNEQQIQRLTHTVRENEKVVSQFEQTLNQRDLEVRTLQESTSPQLRRTTLHEITPEPASLQPNSDGRESRSASLLGGMRITCEDGGRSIDRMARGSATVCGDTVFIRSVGSKDVYSFSFTDKNWERLNNCPQNYFTLVNIKGLVTAIGVDESEEQNTNVLHSYVGSGGRNKNWVLLFPRMKTRRFNPAAISAENWLIVAGGNSESGERLITVEVLDIEKRDWFFTYSLPMPLSQASIAICSDKVYLVGGVDDNKKWTNTVLMCPLSDLQKISSSASSVSPKRHLKLRVTSRKRVQTNPWSVVASAPLVRSTCVCFEKQLLAIGGNDSTDPNEKATNDIYVYNQQADSWDILGHMNVARAQCLVVAITEPCSRAFIIGGWADETMCDDVEVLTLM